MKKQLLTIILILLLLVSWVVIIDLARDNRNLLNALRIAEKFMDESREESLTNGWNEEAIPEYRR